MVQKFISPINKAVALLIFLTVVFPLMLSASKIKNFNCESVSEDTKKFGIESNIEIRSMLPETLSYQEKLHSCKLLSTKASEEFDSLNTELNIEIVQSSDTIADFSKHFNRDQIISFEDKLYRRVGLLLTEIPYSGTKTPYEMQIIDLMLKNIIENLTKRYVYYRLILDGAIYDSLAISDSIEYTPMFTIEEKLKQQINLKMTETIDALKYIRSKYPKYYDFFIKEVDLFYKLFYSSSDLEMKRFDHKNPIKLVIKNLGCLELGFCYFDPHSDTFTLSTEFEECLEPKGFSLVSTDQKQRIKNVIMYLKQDGLYDGNIDLFCEGKVDPAEVPKQNCYQTGINQLLSQNSNSFVLGQHSISSEGQEPCHFLTALWNTSGTKIVPRIEIIFGRFYDNNKLHENVKCNVDTLSHKNTSEVTEKRLSIISCQTISETDLMDLSQRILRPILDILNKSKGQE